MQESVWGKLAGNRKKKRDWAVLNLDGHTKPLYGAQKEGVDFDHPVGADSRRVLGRLTSTDRGAASARQPSTLTLKGMLTTLRPSVVLSTLSPLSRSAIGH